MSAVSAKDVVRYSVVLIGAIASMTIYAPARADSAFLAACQDLEKPIVKIGAPHAYRTILDSVVSAENDMVSEAAKWSFCPVFAYGNDYQILDWLENGQLSAGIMSEFAATVLHASQVDRVVPLYDISIEWPFTVGELREYDIRLTLNDNQVNHQDSLEQFDDILRAIVEGTTPDGQTIVIDSHLSTAFPVLLNFVEKRAQSLNIDLDAETDNFWSAFLAKIEFKISNAKLAGNQTLARIATESTTHQSGHSLTDGVAIRQDVFVYDARLREPLFDGVTEIMPRQRWTAAIEHWIYEFGAENESVGDGMIVAYLDKNFGIHEAGFRKQRHFHFTLNELWRILREVNNASTSLVLTGGGVKAAYQTSLIDHLYGEAFLANKLDDQNVLSTREPIKIDYIIGTSGGALLGLFVSIIDSPKDLDLTNRIWSMGNQERYVESYDIFPVIDMPRYLTLLVSSLILVIFISIGRRVPRLRKLAGIKTIDPKYRVKETSLSGLQPRMFWIAFLFASPWIFKEVIGVPGLQHVPAIAGATYFACLLLAVYSDNRLILKESFRIRKIKFRVWHLVAVIVGILLIGFSIAYSNYAGFSSYWLPLLGKVDTGTLLCCIGLGILAADMHCVLLAQKTHVKLMPRAYIGRAFAVLVAVPFFAYLALFLTKSTLFELTAVFWVRFLMWSAVVSISILAIGYVESWAKGRMKFVRNGLDFLVSDPSGKTQFTRSRRYSRAMWFFVLSFLWWNWIMAPSIYGNEDAKSYVTELYDSAVCPDRHSETSECKDVDPGKLTSVPPKTPFVISATSLEKRKERYFILHPDAYKESCNPDTSLDNDRAIFKLLKIDPRWQSMGCHPTSKVVVDTAFASGSPFPVFPATLVPLADVGEEEWLVDGGFAHNIPIEAANALGAKTILVISSSPLYQSEYEALDLAELKFGNLSHNLTRLFPYLFERSQIEDTVGAQQALVVTLSPTGSDEPWPMLTDFRASTVERMISEAEKDFDQRIGMVESWGPANCRIAGVGYQCNAIESIRN